VSTENEPGESGEQDDVARRSAAQPEPPEPAPSLPAAPPPPEVSGGDVVGSADGPAMSSPAESVTDRPAPPRPVLVSFWIWIAGAVILVLGGLLTLAERNMILANYRAHPPAGVPLDQLPSQVNQLIAVSLVVAVVFAALYVFFAYRIRAGRNWARTVLTVLTVLSVLYYLTVGASIYTYLSLLISVVAVVLLYVPGAREFFQANRAPRG
jgi:hypothetical protein